MNSAPRPSNGGESAQDALIAALRRAVQDGGDTALRLHLAELELAEGQAAAAVTTLAGVLSAEPDNERAAAMMLRALGARSGEPSAGFADGSSAGPSSPAPAVAHGEPPQFDWAAAESDLGISLPPPFAGGAEPAADAVSEGVGRLERPQITLAHVGGLDQVKERLTAAFLAPLRNPELRTAYGKSLRGGLLMYGPPGCGKTFIARALAGELGAKFMAVSAADVLDVWIGSSERNVRHLFMEARREAPCVVFLDELDALGGRRGSSSDTLRNVVNQLLTELDGVSHDNEGVFTLAATNQPWQVDTALRRPGRFDRTVLVLPPDRGAREAIFRHHLEGRPVAGIDLRALAGATEGFSGADIAHVCEAAAERALMDSARTGQVRPIVMTDLRAALETARPSVGQWLETVKNVVLFGEDDGTFAELRAYLKASKRL
ncbi:MAG: ATP-binding protein [Bifidobacteriaceae bacterium]|jgi:AAA+ superfamily predicted ATPase|nr:ATP-binding protein [Bifidobacteriaceae bacterium]